MKMHPLMVNISKPFATIEDIIEQPMAINHVIYNPTLPENKNRELVKKYAFEIFNREISKDILNDMIECKYDVEKFIDKFREFINHKSDIVFDEDGCVRI